MNSFISYYLATIVLLGGYAFFFLRTDGWRKWIGLPLFCLLALWSLAVGVSSLGKPVPVTLVRYIEEPQDWMVLNVIFDEDKAIYLWVLEPNSMKPRNIVLPWNKTKAAEIAGAMEQASQQGGFVQYEPDKDAVSAVKQLEVPKKGNNVPLRGETSPSYE